MKFKESVYLLTLVASLLLVACQHSEATLKERLLQRRQSGESEQESTTAAASSASSQATNNQEQPSQATGGGGVTQLPARLYPDLPQQPGGGAFAPRQPQYGPHHYPPNHGPTPFVPFGLQFPTNRVNPADPYLGRLQPQPPMPRPMTAADRLQSQTFVSGLGRRLLEMVGLDPGASSNETAASSIEGRGPQMAAGPMPDGTMKALQNSTILQQLNHGVQSIYGGLSKMYNSTVQEQISLLRERFKKETENSTNPWQQRMAQQVPMYFKSMAAKVDEAQGNLNRIWQQVMQASNGTPPAGAVQGGQAPPRSFFASFDQFMGNNNNNGPFGPTDDNMFQHPGNFFNQIGRSLGFGGDGGPNQARLDPNDPQAKADWGMAQVKDFWHNQVQPQLGMLRGQVSRVWRELTASGTLTPPEPMIARARNNGGNLGGAPGATGQSPQANNNTDASDIIDDILRGVDLGNSEYTLIPDQQQQQQQNQSLINRLLMNQQMQNGLMRMQREVNQLWGGLSRSLQNALGNVRQAMNPPPRSPFGGQFEPMASNRDNKEVDPAENEIDGKIKDLSKLQRDADTVYDVVQQQQQAQQRPSFGDRFRNFFNNEPVTRFGNAIGDMWNHIPERWDNFVQNMRRPDNPAVMANARLVANSNGTTQAPASSTTSTVAAV